MCIPLIILFQCRFGHAIIAIVSYIWIVYNDGLRIVFRSRKCIKTMLLAATIRTKVITYQSKWEQLNGVAQNAELIICRTK